MESFTVYAEWEAEQPISEEAVAGISEQLRPNDESVCVWFGDTSNRFRLSIDLDELSYEAAGRAGGLVTHEAAELANLTGRLVRVTVCTEGGQADFTDPETELMGTA
ncbi:MAG: hypothetical protein QOG10_5960 [Kribbellaceae bacterium]|jgi:hypothetical protein|nr:hypothetical protein [Kribbellaceae bacterium]